MNADKRVEIPMRGGMVMGVIIFVCSLLVAPSILAAQESAPVHRIGLLSSRSPVVARVYVEALLQGLRDLGYVEGQNLAIESRYAEDKLERLPQLAAELVQLRIAVLVA